MIVYNYDADLEVSDTCVRSSLLSWVELSILVGVMNDHMLYVFERVSKLASNVT